MDSHGIPSSIRAGVGTLTDAHDSGGATDFTVTALSLIQIFAEDAMKTAGEYAIGNNRTVVTDDDVRRSLKYQARLFFQCVEDLEGRVDEAATVWRARLQGDGEDSEDEEGEGGEEEDGEEEGSASGDASSDDVDPAAAPPPPPDEVVKYRHMVSRVNAIAASWPTFAPTDPILQMIKRSIDATDAAV